MGLTLNTLAVVHRKNAMKRVNSLLGEALMVGWAAGVGFTLYPTTSVGLVFVAVAGVSCAGAVANWAAARRFCKRVGWFLPAISPFRLEKHKTLCKKSLIKLSVQTARHNTVLHTARGVAFIGSGLAVASVGNFLVAPFFWWLWVRKGCSVRSKPLVCTGNATPNWWQWKPHLGRKTIGERKGIFRICLFPQSRW